MPPPFTCICQSLRTPLLFRIISSCAWVFGYFLIIAFYFVCLFQARDMCIFWVSPFSSLAQRSFTDLTLYLCHGPYTLYGVDFGFSMCTRNREYHRHFYANNTKQRSSKQNVKIKLNSGLLSCFSANRNKHQTAKREP